MIAVRIFLTLLIVFLASAVLPAEEREIWIQQWGLNQASRPVEYNPGSGQLLANYEDGAVLWDVKTGLALRHYPAPHGISTLAFYDENSILLGSNRSVSLLNKRTGQLIQKIDLTEDHSHRLLPRANNGSLVLICGPEQLQIWHPETGEKLHQLKAEGQVISAAISPDHRLLLTGGKDAVGILWDLETNSILQRFRSTTDLSQVEFSEDGQKFLTNGSGEFWYSYRAIIWDVMTASPQLFIPRIATVSFAANQVRLIYPDGKIELWSLDRHEEAPSHEDWPKYPYTPDNRWLVTNNQWRLHLNSLAQKVTLLGPSSNDLPKELPPQTAFLNVSDHMPIAFSNSGDWLLSGAGRTWNRKQPAAVWNLKEGALKLDMEEKALGAFHPNEKQIILHNANILELIDLESGDVVQTFERDFKETTPACFTSVQFTQDGTRLLTACGDWYNGDLGAILLWDVNTGKLLRDYAKSTKAVLYAAFTEDEKQIVAALTQGDDGSAGINEVTIFDAESGNVLRTKNFQGGGIAVGRIDPTGRLLPFEAYSTKTVEGYDSKGSFLLDLKDLSIRSHFRGKPTSFNRTGEVLANFEYAGTLSYRDAVSGEILHASPTNLQFHDFAPFRFTLFHPGQLLLAGSLQDSRQPSLTSKYAVGFKHVLTGEIEAELFLLKEPNQWIIKTKGGAINGSEKGLARVTWRVPGTLQVERNTELTKAAVDPVTVGKTLTQSLPEDVSLRDELKNLPTVEIPDPPPKPKIPEQWPNYSEERRLKIAEKLRTAGATLRIVQFNHITVVHLEKQKVTDELLSDLRWLSGVGRLYLADTGITDEQLDMVGILRNVTRMSLWGNPITDRGLKELTSMWKLEVLDIHGTNITAEGLNALQSLPNLKTLIIPDRIDPANLAPLTKKHPELEIILRADNHQTQED